MKTRLLTTLLLTLVAVPVLAGAPLPEIPKGKGDQCVEDTQEMRVNHMEKILHQRDETVHQGIRTKKHSLKGCIDCHAVAGDDGQPVSIESPKHFCNVCHQYAAVRVDCFQCHNSRPEPKQSLVSEQTSTAADVPAAQQ